MAVTQIKTFADIYNAVLRRAKVPTDDTVSINTIKEFINSRYMEMAAEKKWRWRTEHRDIQVPAKYTTGTIAVTNGSRTITGTGTNWVADFNHRYLFKTSDEEHYQIVAVPSTTSMLLSSPYAGTTSTGSTYTVYKPIIGLFPDLEKIEDIWHDYFTLPMKARGPEFISKLYTKFPEEENKAVFYTRVGYKEYDNLSLGTIILGYDFLGESSSYAIKIFPGIADAAYTLHVDYSKRITPLDGDTDEPIIPPQNRVILMYGALADFYSVQRNDMAYQLWNAKYDKELMEMKGDTDDTDDYPKLSAQDKWRGPVLTPGNVDLGSLFDKYYSLEDIL